MVTINKDLQAFILTHEMEDERRLVLKHKVIHGIPTSIVADQISGRRKAKTKLPAFFQTAGIFYPPSVNLEQSSSELTAQFKAKLMAGVFADAGINASPVLKSVVDLTGGFGVDSFFISQVCDQLDFVESNAALLEIARHNHKALGATNIRYHTMDAKAYLNSTDQKSDFVFIDPSRRNNTKKVFRLAECQPDVVELLPSIFELTNWVLVKASPLLDLQKGLLELKFVAKIFVVAVEDECREVLFLCSKAQVAEPVVTAINLSGRKEAASEEFHFMFPEERNSQSTFSDPLTYLYEPYASILKAGAFKLVGNHHGLAKIQVHTHLYTSDRLVDSFPGRIFRIENRKVTARELKGYLPELKANVLVRNYPLSPEQLKKKLKLRDGGEKYVIGFSGAKEKFLVLAARVK
jgi:hypothetical protein